MKIKNLLSIPVMLLTLALAGCNGGTDSTNSASTNSVNLSNKLTSAENNGLLITNPSSADINWGSDTLVNIPIGAKGLKAIKVTNTTNQPFNKLTLETSANKPQSITIDNNRTTCSMGLPLAANTSCLYVFSYSPVGSYESGIFTATVSAEQADNNAKVSVSVDYSTRVSANAGTLAVNVDTSALNCPATSCNGTLYVVNSKGAKVSTVVNITGNNGTVFGAGLVNLDPNDSYTIEASPINGSIPTYSPNQTVTLVADATTTVTVKYPAVPVSSGKAIITLPNVLPAYTGTLKMQILNTKNSEQVVDSEDLKQGDKAVVDLPVSDATHSYVVKLANGIADPVSGLFYDQESETPLELKESGITNLSIPMAKATSLSNVTLSISGLQYESKTSSATDTASVSFSDADNHYKYVNQYNQLSGSKIYKVKNGLNFTIQTQANGTNSYKVNPIVNTFNVDGTKSVVATFKTGTNVMGSAKIYFAITLPSYKESLPVQILNTKNGNQVVKEFTLKQGDTIAIDGLPSMDESHDYIVLLPYGIANPRVKTDGYQYQCIPIPLEVTNVPTEQQELSMNCVEPQSKHLTLKISGLKESDTATIRFIDSVRWRYVDSNDLSNGDKQYYLPTIGPSSVIVQATDYNYEVNPIFMPISNYGFETTLTANFTVPALRPINRFNSQNATGQPSFTMDGKYMYSTTINGYINRYNVGSNGSINYSGMFGNGTTLGGLVVYQNGYVYALTSPFSVTMSLVKFNILSNGDLTFSLEGSMLVSVNNSLVVNNRDRTISVVSQNGGRIYNTDINYVSSFDFGANDSRVYGAAINSSGNLMYTVEPTSNTSSKLSVYTLGYYGVSSRYFEQNINYRATKVVLSPNEKNLYISDGSTVGVYRLNSSGSPSFVRNYSNLSGNIAVSADSKYFYTTDTSWINQYAIGD